MKTIDHAARAAEARAAAERAYARPPSLGSLHAHSEAVRKAEYHEQRAAEKASQTLYDSTKDQRKSLVERADSASKIVAKHEKARENHRGLCPFSLKNWRAERFERLYQTVKYGKDMDKAAKLVEILEKYAESGVAPGSTAPAASATQPAQAPAPRRSRPG